jgi:C4-dicarboxylate transporter, DctM subunit
MSISIMLLLTVILLVMGLPLYVVFLFPSIVVLILFLHIPLEAAIQSSYNCLDNFPLLAVPFFILSGSVMGGGGLSRRLVDWIMSIIGRMRGGLGITTVATCTFFGAITGSSPATVASLGPLLVPHLLDNGYSKKMSLGLITSCGALAIIIPPSIAMVLFGAVGNVSIGGLFLGGILPGVTIALVISCFVFYRAHVEKIGKLGDKLSLSNILQRTKGAIWAIGMPIIILGGIYSGIFTPTEAAGVSAVYAIIVAIFIYKELTLKAFISRIIDSALLTGQILIILTSAGVYAWVLTVSQVPQQLVTIVQTLDLSLFMVLILFNIILLIAGMFIDPPSAIVIFTPLFMPLTKAMGMDPLHLGIVMTVNLAIGMFSPPFGLNLFVSQAVFKVEMPVLVQSILPYGILYLFCLAIITYVPSLSLWLPRLLGF